MYHNGAMKVAAVEESESGKQTSDMGSLPQRIELEGQELKDFISGMVPDWSRPLHPPNLEMEEAMTRIFEEEVACGRLTNDQLKRVKIQIPLYCYFGEMCYHSHTLEEKLLISLYTGLLILVDDLSNDEPEKWLPELQRFVNHWGDKSKAHEFHPHLNHCHRVLTVDIPKYYGPVATSYVIHAVMNFFVGTMLEARYPKGMSNCPKTSARYPRYMRFKTGISESYAHFQFPKARFPEEEYLEFLLPAIPDMQKWTDTINDLLSFYKEHVVGTEEITYLKTMSRIHECNPLEVWRDTFRQMAPLARDITATLSRREGLQKSWEVFKDGYIRWHIGSSRYRLAEIGVMCPEGMRV